MPWHQGRHQRFLPGTRGQKYSSIQQKLATLFHRLPAGFDPPSFGRSVWSRQARSGIHTAFVMEKPYRGGGILHAAPRRAFGGPQVIGVPEKPPCLVTRHDCLRPMASMRWDPGPNQIEPGLLSRIFIPSPPSALGHSHRRSPFRVFESIPPSGEFPASPRINFNLSGHCKRSGRARSQSTPARHSPHQDRISRLLEWGRVSRATPCPRPWNSPEMAP